MLIEASGWTLAQFYLLFVAIFCCIVHEVRLDIFLKLTVSGYSHLFNYFSIDYCVFLSLLNQV